MPRGRPLFIRGHAAIVSAALTGLALAAPTTAFGDVSVTRAELKSGQLRVEGRGALPNAAVTVTADSVASSRADGSGAFRVEASGYRSSSCGATVGDGATAASVTLDDCTVTTPAPTPTPSPTPTPTPTPVPTSSFVIVDDVLPSGNVGTAYNASLFSRGASGNDPVEYRVVLGRLPAGLSMTRSFGVASALITGTPTTVGTSAFTVEARDGSGQTVRKAFSIAIDPPLPLVITNLSDQLAPGTVGVDYRIQLFANGGIKPYTWALESGQVPVGLRLSGSGLISGMPTAAGTFAFTVRAADQAGARTTRQFVIAVSG